MNVALHREFDQMVAEATAPQVSGLMTAGAILSKSSPTIQSQLQDAYRQRDKHLTYMSCGGPTADDVKQWRAEHTDEAARTMSDDDVLKTLRAAASQKGMALATEISRLETTLEVVSESAARSEEIARRRASLSADDARSLSQRVENAEATLVKIEQRAQQFADRYPPGSATDSGIERRRAEIAAEHGVASGKLNDAKSAAAYFGVQ